MFASTLVIAACGKSEPDSRGDLSVAGEGGSAGNAGAGGRAGAISVAGSESAGTSGSAGNGTAGSAGAASGSGGAGAAGSSGSGAGLGGSAGGGAAGSAGAGSAGRPVFPLPEGWGPARAVPTESTSGMARPGVSMDSNGTAHVLAYGGGDLTVTPFDVDSEWGTPAITSSDATSSRGVIAMNRDDEGFAIWDGSEDGVELLIARHDPVAGWLEPEPVGTTSGEIDDLALAVSRTGKAIAVWVRPSAAIRSTHFDGSSWSAPVDVSPFEANDLGFPSVGIDDEGRGLVVWRDVPDVGTFVAASRFDGTSWSTPENLCSTTDAAGLQCYLQSVAMTQAGDAVAAMEVDYTLNAIAFSPDGGWGTFEPLVTEERRSYGAHPSLGFDDAGNLLLIWREEIEDYDFRCHGLRRNAAGEWGEASLLQPEKGETDSKVLAVAPDGRAVAFFGKGGSGTIPGGFWASYYTPEAGWGEPAIVDEGGSGAGADEVSAAINANGQAVVVWTRRDDAGASVMARRFDPP
jgi:hypothetical protein